MPATSNSVLYVNLMPYVIPVKLPSFQLLTEVQLVFVLQLMFNQEVHVCALMASSRIMANVSSAPLHNVLNVQLSQLVKPVQLPSS